MKKTIILLLFLSFMFQLPAQAFWGKKPLPRINTQSKIDYVNINWWDNFSDPYLRCYILKAIKNNHDAQKASWKVEEYRQAVKNQFSQQLPSLSVGADYVLNHLGEVSPAIKSSVFAVPFTASYEADIFLKNKTKTKSSQKAYDSSKFQEQSIYISLASDVATTYINIVKYDKQIQLQKSLITIKKEELAREQFKYQNGVSSIPQINEYKQSYETAVSELKELTKTRDKALNQLAILIGESPENAQTIKRNSLDNLVYAPCIPKEVSSDVILSRPDILAAESNLEKAKIDVNIARKEFLPKINLTGIYAFSSFGTGGFGSWESTIAALLAGASMDLFKGGQKTAKLKANKAIYEQIFEEYMQTNLNALKEVNDSLLVIKQDKSINESLCKKLAIQKDTNNRSLDKYKQGVIAYSDMLVDQEKYISIEQSLVNSKATCFIDYISLYKAVGGKL